MVQRTSQKIFLSKEDKENMLMYARCKVENSKIAEIMGWPERTFYTVLNNNPEFKLQFKEVKAISNARAENSLYNQAVGFYQEEEKVVTLSGGLHSKSTSETVTYMKYYPPSFGATKHYLSNRDPDRWKDSRELIVKTEDIPDDELEAMVREIIKNEEEENGQDSE